MIKSFRCGFAALVVGLLGVAAQAEVLVYDGFPITGSGVTGAYSATNRSKLVDANVTNAGIIGFKDTKWQSSTGVIYSFTSGLSLPAGFDELPSAAYVGAGSAGANADGANDERGVWKTLKDETVSAIKEAKELHYRVLLSADENALTALTVSGSDNNVPDKSALSAGFYLSSANHYGSARNSNGKTTRAVSFAIRRVNTTTYKVSLLVMGTEDALTTSGAIRTYDLATYTAGSTMICYAKITKDAGADQKEKIEAWVQDVTAYNPKQDFQTSVEAQLIDTTGTGAPNAFDFACGSYTTKKGFFNVDEIALATKGEDILVLGLAGAPKVASARLERTASGYQVTGTVTKSSADVVGVILTAPTSTETTIPGAGVTVEGDVAADFTRSFTTEELAADTTYAVTAYAANTVDTDRREAGTFYTGALTLAKVQDAAEKDAVVGQVTVSRAAADPYPLTVNYTLTSTCEAAVEGRTWVAPTPVVIPANETSATLTLTPKNDMSVDEDISVTLALADGNYDITAEPVELTLVNNSVPRDVNVWVAGADGLASDAGNWSYGHAPRADEAVLFNGDYSTAACTWDADAEGGPSATIASLKVASTYTKTITILTTYPEVAGSNFHTFTVTGNMTVEGGAIAHGKHDATHPSDYYRLRLDVGGDLTIATGASLSGYARGSFGKHTAGGDASYGGSYNGAFAWGSLKEPYSTGSSSNSSDGAGGYPAWAGGAIWVEVAGNTTLDGSIACEGVHVKTQWDTFSGSGGAVYLKTKTLAGTGTISGSAATGSRGSNMRSGAGGRVAVVLTDSELTDFPIANIRAYSSITSMENVGGAGTVFVQTPQTPNGILYLKDRSNKYDQYGYHPKVNQLTDIPKDQTWKLDGIVFGANAILRVSSGTTLELPNGLASVSSAMTDHECGLLVQGGTLTLPEGDQTISGGWMLQTTGYTIDGNVTVSNGGSIGALPLYNKEKATFQCCDLTVTGDLTVESGSHIFAQRGGYIDANANVPGGTTPSCHGGQNARHTGNKAYGSFFDPVTGGAFGGSREKKAFGCGAVKLTVGGTLTLDGVATAHNPLDTTRPGAGGSLNFTVGRLAGNGSIDASGHLCDYYWTNIGDDNYGASGGGRVAVRLTAKDATFSDAWLAKITARGALPTKEGGLKGANGASAGSVYLQDGSHGEKGGTIYIRNGNQAANEAWTALPSKDTVDGLEGADTLADFKHASLSILDCAKVRLYNPTELRMNTLTLAANTKLDLNGKTLTVSKAFVNGSKLATGTYTKDSADVSGYVTGEGSLVVTGGGLVLFLK